MAILPSPHADAAKQFRHAAAWRVLLLFTLLGTCVLLHFRAGGEMDEAVLYVYVILAVSCVAGGMTYVWFRTQSEITLRETVLTLGADLAMITALTAYSGGVDSIFGALYMVVILEATSLSGLRASLATATVASLAYGVVAVVHQTGGFNQALHLRIGITEPGDEDLWAYAGLRIFAFYLVAILSGYLARRIGHLERQQSALLENFATGYLAADPDGRVTFINSAGRRILGAGAPAVLGTPVGEVFRTDPPGRNPAALSLRLRKEFFESPCMHWRPDGQAVPLHVTTAFIRGAGHEVDGVMAHFSDQTMVQELENTVRQQDRLALVGEFSASLAHEVRNPVAAIRGAAQELSVEDDAITAVNRDLLRIILRETDQLNSVVTHFLDYARVNVQHAHPVDVQVLLEDVVGLLHRDPDRLHGVTIDTQYQMGRAEVAADVGLLKEAFLNIAQNALDAMPTGGTLRIATQPAPRPGLFDVLFEDTGQGMPEGDLDQIFQPFFTRKPQGTGLGLAIVQRIVEAHHGEILVSSQPGQGTRMRVRLPAVD